MNPKINRLPLKRKRLKKHTKIRKREKKNVVNRGSIILLLKSSNLIATMTITPMVITLLTTTWSTTWFWSTHFLSTLVWKCICKEPPTKALMFLTLISVNFRSLINAHCLILKDVVKCWNKCVLFPSLQHLSPISGNGYGK